MKKAYWIILVIVLIVIVGAITILAFPKKIPNGDEQPAEVASKKIMPPESGAYLGMFPGWGDYEDAVKTETITEFNKLVGKNAAFVPYSVFFGQNYISNEQLKAIDAAGAIPMVRFMPWGEPYWSDSYQPKYSLQKIIDGEFDDFLNCWADTIKNFEKPVMVNFGVEMNGNWFAWSGTFQGGVTKTKYGNPKVADGPERFIGAWRHIVNLFKNKQVENVTWYWHVNNANFPSAEWNTIEAYYPGDEYVDWVAFSAYGAQTPDEEWISFESVLDSAYNTLTQKYPQKPLMLAEWGAREVGGNRKAEFYSDALSSLQTKYNKIKIAVLYTERWEEEDNVWTDLRVNSSDASLAAYKSGIAEDYYIGEYQK